MTDHVLLDIKAGVATLTLNRPEARNAYSIEMREALATYANQLEHDTAVRAVVIQGAGGNFLGGGDVKGQMERQKLAPPERMQMSKRTIHTLHFFLQRLRRMPKPVIASIQGAVAGAGVGLVGACDLAIASDNAYFIIAHVHVGLSADGGTTYFMPRIVGLKRAAELMLLGNRIDAQTALAYGIVNRVVPLAEHEAAVAEIARTLANGPTVAMGRTKALLEVSLNNTLETQLELEGIAVAECTTTEDHYEGALAFIEKRKPVFKGR